jgi:hypothetical protein
MTQEHIGVFKVMLANGLAILLNVADMKDWINLEVIMPHIDANIGDIIQNALSIVSLILAICYTAWKWTNDIRKKKANIKEYYEQKNGRSK